VVQKPEGRRTFDVQTEPVRFVSSKTCTVGSNFYYLVNSRLTSYTDNAADVLRVYKLRLDRLFVTTVGTNLVIGKIRTLDE